MRSAPTQEKPQKPRAVAELNLFAKTAPEPKPEKEISEEEHNPLLGTPKLEANERIQELDQEDNNSVEGSVKPIEKEEPPFFDQNQNRMGGAANLIKKSISMDDLHQGKAMMDDEEEEEFHQHDIGKAPFFNDARTCNHILITLTHQAFSR